MIKSFADERTAAVFADRRPKARFWINLQVSYALAVAEENAA